MSYLLSIVVPTKDRYFYLKYLIQLVKGFESDEIELVIQDNTKDNTEITEFIEHLNYKNLKYYHDNKNLSIVQNSDLAILHSSGEYVCYMGDDDAVMPNIVYYTRWMKENNIDALKSSDVIYYWPDTKPGRHISNAGKLIFKKYNKAITNRNPLEALLNVLRKGCLNKGNIPVVYHGIVKRSILDICYEQTGTFFPAPCPDMANGVAMSLIVNNYAYVDEPVTISGASKHHGGKSAIKQKYLRLEDMFWMSDSEKSEWDSRLLRYGVAESIYANSTIKVLGQFNRQDLLGKLNFDRYYAWVLVNYPDLSQEVKSLTKPSLKLYVNYAYCLTRKLKNRIIDILCYVLKKERNASSAGPFETINDAVKYLEKNNE